MERFSKNSPEQQRKIQQYQEQMQKRDQRQQMQTARKRLKRNLQPKGPRRNSWEREDYENWDDAGYESDERIMPRDENDRRRTVEMAAFQTPLSQGEDTESKLQAIGTQQGTVTSVSGGLCRVEIDRQTILCSIRGSLTAEESGFTNTVATGDEVVVNEDGTGGGVIEEVLPRRSFLARPDVFRSHLQQIVVANAHQLLIVASWRDPIIWLELIDRYLIAAERSNLQPIICITKADLIEDEALYHAAIQPYQSLGHRIILTSSYTNKGIDEVHDALRDKVTVLAGMSGTGKSSIILAVQPGLELRTNAVSEYSGEGRHTTTQATLHSLDSGGSVVDTPGIREFGLAGLRRVDLAGFFPEIAEAAPDCRFNNCSHINEPDCAVQDARTRGEIAASRYHSYQVIYDSLQS